MSSALKTYDPSKVKIATFGGRIDGWADGTFVTAKRMEDKWTTTIGAGGEPTRTRNLNDSGEIELTLKQSSRANDMLSAALELGTVGPVAITDLGGGTLVSCAQAYVKKVADVEFGKELGNRVWTLSCPKLTIFVGGNPDT